VSEDHQWFIPSDIYPVFDTETGYWCTLCADKLSSKPNKNWETACASCHHFRSVHPSPHICHIDLYTGKLFVCTSLDHCPTIHENSLIHKRQKQDEKKRRKKKHSFTYKERIRNGDLPQHLTPDEIYKKKQKWNEKLVIYSNVAVMHDIKKLNKIAQSERHIDSNDDNNGNGVVVMVVVVVVVLVMVVVMVMVIIMVMVVLIVVINMVLTR